MHSWKGARGTANLSAVWIIRPPTHTPAQKCFITHVRARVYACASRIHGPSLPLWTRYTRAPICSLCAKKQTRIPFLMRTGAKVFYNVDGDTRARVSVSRKTGLTYRDTSPLRESSWSRDVDHYFVFSFCRRNRFVDRWKDVFIYRTGGIRVKLFIRKLCENEIRVTVSRFISLRYGRDIFCIYARKKVYTIHIHVYVSSSWEFRSRYNILSHINIFH